MSKRGPGNPMLTETSATKAELTKLTNNALDTFMLSINNTVDLHSTESVQNAIIQYFRQCADNGIRPGNLGLYAALGMSKQDVNNVLTGKSKSKASLDCIDLIKKATLTMGAFRESLVLENKINPVTYIFMGKNYDGLEDQSRVELVASRGPDANMTPDQISKQIERDIPIDIE